VSSPEDVRTSFAAAITLGLMEGKFFRNAKLFCLNLLLTYKDGCVGSCAYCGLSRARVTGESWDKKSFIRVDWPTFRLDQITSRMESKSCSHLERVCISMITHKKAPSDTLSILRYLRAKTDAISVLIAPTIVSKEWMYEAKKAGADKVGVAIDAATPELFEKLRGRGVSGPHKWERYWAAVEEAVDVFGRYNVGIHLIVGLGETEKEAIETIYRGYCMGAFTHLFSFFPEERSLMHRRKQPPIGSYRRVQLARYLVNIGKTSTDRLRFDKDGNLLDYGVDNSTINDAIESGIPFMTSGCSTKNMNNACNRPFSDSTPYQASVGELRNFPFVPDQNDIITIRKQLLDYTTSSDALTGGVNNCLPPVPETIP